MTYEHSVSSLSDPEELTPCSTREALQRELVNVEVSDDEQAVLSASRRGHHKYFARVRVAAFDDLQALGLVPRRLREQEVRTAIASDDQDALRLSHELVTRRSAPAQACTCEPAHGHPPSFGRELRTNYRDIRKEYHPALSRILSDHFGTDFAWDSTLAGSVHGWVRRVTVRELIATVSIFNDITIGRNATLVLDETSTVLLAREIRIHRTGELIHKGGFLRIWARSIDSFNFLADFRTRIELNAPWHLSTLGDHNA